MTITPIVEKVHKDTRHSAPFVINGRAYTFADWKIGALYDTIVVWSCYEYKWKIPGRRTSQRKNVAAFRRNRRKARGL